MHAQQQLDSYLMDFNQDKKPMMEMVHLSKSEIAYFTLIQGGQSVDPETGLREFSKLSEIVREPQLRDLLIELSELQNKEGHLPHEINNYVDANDPFQGNPEIEPIESDEDPYIQHMRDAGGRVDKYLCLLPSDLVAFMEDLEIHPKKDSEYGLPEFWGFGEIGRAFGTIAGGIGGFMLGGPLGAGIGAGLGNAAGRVASGQSFSNALMPAAKMGLGAGLGAWALGPSGLGMIGAGGQGLSAGMANFSAPGAAAVTETGKNLVPEVTGGSGLMASAKPYMLPAALIGGGLMMAQKGHRQQQQSYEQERQRREEKRKKEAEDFNKMNLDTKIMGPTVPRPSSYLGPSTMYQRGGRVAYKQGGNVTGKLIKGKGNGQDDLIHRTLKEGDWVWDASTTADLGDGSSKAGDQEIQNFEKFIKKEKKHIPLMKEKPRDVPCALSDHERVTHNPIVSLVGDGSNEKGAQILRTVTKLIRRHKNSNGDQLPPPSHGLVHYYKKAIGGGK